MSQRNVEVVRVPGSNRYKMTRYLSNGHTFERRTLEADSLKDFLKAERFAVRRVFMAKAFRKIALVAAGALVAKGALDRSPKTIAQSFIAICPFIVVSKVADYQAKGAQQEAVEFENKIESQLPSLV